MIRIILTSYMPDWARCEIAMQVIASLAEYLHADEPIALHIADDGSPENFYADLISTARRFELFSEVTGSVASRLGIGGSLNKALLTIEPDELFMYITDDWQLIDYLDLTIATKLIRTQNYDYVRLGPIHPNLKCIIYYAEYLEYWLHIYHGEGGYAFATRPFLANKRFYNMIGKFDENLDAYDTERLYAERVHRSSLVRLASVSLLDTRGLWQHLGDASPVGKIKPQAAL